MHNKMEIEGAASDAARPQAADFSCEAGRMRRFDGQICSLSGKNAAETARMMAGSRLATRMRLPQTRLTPTQKIRMEPTRDR